MAPDASESPRPSQTPGESSGPSPQPEPSQPKKGAAASQASSSAAAPKRGRGRPRKDPSRPKEPKKSPKVDKTEPKAPKTPKPEAEPPKPVTPKDVRVALEDLGDLLNGAICGALGVYPDEWPEIGVFSTKDLDELQEPLARIVNKYKPLAPVVQKSDEIIVTFKLGRWVIENVEGAAAARRYVKVERGGEEDGREVPNQALEAPEGDRVGETP